MQLGEPAGGHDGHERFEELPGLVGPLCGVEDGTDEDGVHEVGGQVQRLRGAARLAQGGQLEPCALVEREAAKTGYQCIESLFRLAQPFEDDAVQVSEEGVHLMGVDEALELSAKFRQLRVAGLCPVGEFHTILLAAPLTREVQGVHAQKAVERRGLGLQGVGDAALLAGVEVGAGKEIRDGIDIRGSKGRCAKGRGGEEGGRHERHA